MTDSRFLRALWAAQAERSLNDQELAGRLRVSKAMVSRLKSGERMPGRLFIEATLREFPQLLGYLLPTDGDGTPAASARDPPPAPSRTP